MTNVVERVLLSRSMVRDRGAERTGARIRLRCPNPEHRTRSAAEGGTPSFYVDVGGPRSGRGRCYGCGMRTTWRELVRLLELPRGLQFVSLDEPGDLFTDEQSSRMLGGNMVREDRQLGTLPWPPDRWWRGVSGKLIRAMGGALVPHRRDEPMLRLPAMIRGQTNYIDCTLRANSDGLSYLNADGPWSKHGLFPYDFVRARRPRILTLTEGVRDPLVTMQNGMWSLSQLGSENWTEKTARLLHNLNPEMVVIMMDPDDAGERAAARAYRDIVGFAMVRVVWLPSRMETLESGVQVRRKILDPADLSRRQLHRALALAGVVKDGGQWTWQR